MGYKRAYALVSFFACAIAAADGKQDAEEEIRRALNQWPIDIAEGRSDSACGLFAPDVVLSFPGQPDRDFAVTCARLKKTMGKRVVRYDAPKIEEIQVRGELAFVRLVWTAHEKRPDGREELIRERGLDVFERQKDGRFRIRVSHAFPAHAAPQ